MNHPKSMFQLSLGFTIGAFGSLPWPRLFRPVHPLLPGKQTGFRVSAHESLVTALGFSPFQPSPEEQERLTC